jgi:hypothetical protein
MQGIKKKAGLALVVAAGLLPGAALAQMPDFSDVRVTIGAKAWNNSWSTWFPELAVQTFVPIVGDRFRVDAASVNIYNRESVDRETVFIPQLSIRTGNFVVSGSAFGQKTYTFGLNTSTESFTSPTLREVSFERKEYDVNLGYFIAPNVALAVGYKDWRNESSVSDYQFQGKGPTLGISVSTPMAAGLNFYGNFAYGFPKVKTNFSIPTLVTSAQEKRGTYILGEVGVAYPLNGLTDTLSGFVLTGGYRYQRLTSPVTLPTYIIDSAGNFSTLVGERVVKLTDSTEGFTLGVLYSF